MFLGIAGTPQGSVVVVTDADWAEDVEDRRSYSGIAVWVKGSVENMWYPVYASSKKQEMVCLSSGESELMALVGGACEGIATRGPMEQNVHTAHLGRLCCARTVQQLWDS